MIFPDKIDLGTIRLPQDPIFIVGCSRSGTTLLQALLMTQENVYSLPETHFFSIISGSIITDGKGFLKTSCLPEVLKDVKMMMGLEFPAATKGRLFSLAEQKCLDKKAFFELIVFSFLYRQIQKYDLQSIVLIEKTPFHFTAMEEIVKLYPKARFIGIIRHPVAVITSRKKNIIQDKNLAIKKLATQWNRMISLCENFQEKKQEQIYLLKYEDLVQNVSRKMSELSRFLNIKYNPDLLEKYKDVTDGVILPWETWKRSVSKENILNTNEATIKEARFFDAIRIQSITKKYMKKYQYDILFPKSQKIWDRCLSVLGGYC
jgi:hypothetical protein